MAKGKKEKAEKNNGELWNMVSVMLAVTGSAALVLGVVYKLTMGPIQKAKDNKELAAVSKVVSADFDNNPFEEKTLIGEDQLELYPLRKDGKITAIAVKTYSNNAFGGRIVLMVGFGLDGTISGYEVLESKETPGLGTKVEEEKFVGQFIGLRPGKHNIRVKKDGGEIDAVTSATISSRAVSEAISKAYQAYSNFTGSN